MSTLKGLAPTGRALLTKEFLRGDQETVDATEHVEELGLGREIDLAPLRAVIEEAMRTKKSRESDAWLGSRVHATLRLTRREASDKRIWEYLNVVEFPDYVRWRWDPENDDETAPKTRFSGQDSENTFARLWWAAELTRNGPDYARTKIALEDSNFSKHWQRLNALHHRTAALAVVDFLSDFGGDRVSGSQGQRMARAVNVALRTVCLDALVPNPPMDAEAISEWIAEKIDETTMMDKLPLGPDEALVPNADVATVRKFLDELADRIRLSAVKADRRPTPALLGME